MGCPFLNFISFEMSDGEVFIDTLRETAKINITFVQKFVDDYKVRRHITQGTVIILLGTLDCKLPGI